MRNRFQTSVASTTVFCQTPAMPKEILFSSYLCDCGHQIDFSENTVSEVKQKSQRKRQWLIETCADRAEEHVIVFDGGEMVDILCPNDGGRQKETKKQGQYLAFIHQYTNVHGIPPAEHEMQRHFGVSAPSIHQMVLNLEKKGLIERTPGMARSIRVLVPPRDLPR
jgi:predicted Rossmann fold nucleotide-binding protein DprA/Smf involved in DNA uptake